MIRTLLLLAALGPCATAPLAGQEPSAAADTARLRFGWTAGTTARVDFERLRIRDTGAGVDTSRIAYAYTMRVEAHPEGLVVRSSDAVWEEIPGDEAEPLARMMKALAAGGIPGGVGSVIASDGEFLRVTGLGELREALLQGLGGSLESMEGAAGVEDILSSLLTEEALELSAAQEWTSLVGFWLAADLEVGSFYEFEDEMDTGLVPGMPIPAVVVFGAEERVPCSGDEGAARCIRLITETIPEPEAFEALTRRLMTTFGVPEREADALAMEMDVEVLTALVAEEGTLLPHLLTAEKHVVVSSDDATFIQSDIDTTRFTYER
jgi:hypothetical protein